MALDMSKSLRRMVAWIAMLGIVLAQTVAAAHACRLGEVNARVHGAAVVAIDSGQAAPCAVPCHGHDAGPAPVANFCEVHCTDGASPVAALDLPPMVQAPLPVALVPLEEVAAGAPPLADDVDAQSCAPPRGLQFCRLLI